MRQYADMGLHFWSIPNTVDHKMLLGTTPFVLLRIWYCVVRPEAIFNSCWASGELSVCWHSTPLGFTGGSGIAMTRLAMVTVEMVAFAPSTAPAFVRGVALAGTLGPFS